MSTIVTRAGKGSPLTWNEVDNNFTNLNTDKYQSGSNVSLGTIAGTTITSSALTSGRVTFASTGGLLADSSSFTYNGSQLNLTGTAYGGLNLQSRTDAAQVSASLFFTTSTSGNYLMRGDTGSLAFLSGAIIGSNGGTERMRLDSSGNLGLGVTPSAWINSTKAFQFGSYGALNSTTGGYTTISNNQYGNASGTPIYLNTDFASAYQQYQGQHRWFTAPSGTAGNAITFTQAMTLHASGALSIGNTTDAGANGVLLGNSAFTGSTNFNALNSSGQTSFGTQGTTAYGALAAGDGFVYTTKHVVLVSDSASGAIKFATGAGAIERMRIDASGNLLVGTTAQLVANNFQVNINSTSTTRGLIVKVNNSATPCSQFWVAGNSLNNTLMTFTTDTSQQDRGSIVYNRSGGVIAYNTTSDYRAKDIIGHVENALEDVSELKVHLGLMKGATQARPMFIAHELQEFIPYAVTGEKDAVDEEGKPIYQQLDASILIPLLTKAIQELKAELDITKAKVAVLEIK